MRIKKIQTAVIESNYDWTIIKITADNGLIGWGEASLEGKPVKLLDIPLTAGMSIGVLLVCVELIMMLVILVFMPREVAGAGAHWAFAPCVATAQNIRWGRTYESFSDDPELAGRLAR